MTVLLELCLELVQTPHQINDECILLLRCQVLDVGHLRHVPHYAQPGSSLQALNSYAAAKKSRQKKAAHTASSSVCLRAPKGSYASHGSIAVRVRCQRFKCAPQPLQTPVQRQAAANGMCRPGGKLCVGCRYV